MNASALDLGYDIDGWDRWCSIAFFIAIVVYLGWRFRIATPIDGEH